MELLRIVAMLLVMVDHATFLSLGVPGASAVTEAPWSSFSIFLSQGLATVCVNTFVLLSGWFGITLRWHKLWTLLFQTLFFSTLVYLAVLAIDPATACHTDSLLTVLCLNANDYWFVKCYVVLFLLAPCLNAFVTRGDERQLRHVLIAFYVFQSVYAWVFINGAPTFGGGYSAVSFVGLYMLARYVRLYGGKFVTHSWRVYLSVYFFIGFTLAVVAWMVTRMGLPIAGRLFTYTNPLVILQSLSLVVAFSRMKFQSRTINWMASSAFAAYLLHSNELVLRTHYGRIIGQMYEQLCGWQFLCFVMLFIAIIFVVAVLLDKLRMALWDSLTFVPCH